jgi:predicted nucleotidyltransferase
MKKLTLLPVLLISYHLLFSQTFTEQTGISLTGVDESSVAWGDYDNDGDLDILLTGDKSFYDPISKIYKNNGNNTFTEQTGISLTGVYNGSVAWGDYDNDGDLDILLAGDAGYLYYISKIYKNNGNNTFTEQTGISLTGVGDCSVAWGDFDNDGYLDILLTGDSYSASISKIYKNNGDNTFTEQTNISLTGVEYGSVAWGDYDNDGDLDILLTGRNSNSNYISKIYKNNGNNTFTEQTGISLTGVSWSSVAWGDYDNDGDLDILLAGDKGSSLISKIYKNNGNNTYTEQTGISLTGVTSGSVAWGDYDYDGDLDVLLAGLSGTYLISKIYKNNSDNTFTEQTGISLSGIYDGSAAWSDYDNDGDLDILLTGDSKCKIYKNEGSTFNTCPLAPSCSIPIVDKSHVTLSWGKATDAQTPSDGLSYNLCIKRVSDGSLAMSPMSDLTNGFRRVVQLGNITQALTCTVQNLDYGEYEWYIQSVDHCFAGSFFSKGQNFYILTLLAPTKLAAIATSKSEVILTWVDNSKCETGYVVERSTGNNQNFSIVDTLDSNSITYTDKGVYLGTHYLYRVKALQNNISSEYSNESDATTNFFSEQTGISLTGVDNSSVAWGDYDNDGDLDILLTGNGISKIYKNNGNNSFIEQTGIKLTGVDYSSVAWGDYDNDGYLDILLTGYVSYSNYISKIYKNNGNNTFTMQTGISLTGVYNGSVAWGDYDKDGDLDILLNGRIDSGCISKIYKNNGNNTFSEQNGIALTGVFGGSVAWGDYDNDGDLDILLTGNSVSSNYISKIYNNNGNNTFTEQTGISLTGVYDGSVAWGDYDNDGDLDILLTGKVGTYSFISKIYRNNGDNTFTEQTGISLTGVGYGSVAWGDYNNDGYLDILLTGYPDNTYVISKIYKNNGNNTFSAQTEISLKGVDNSSVAWGDYDNDGDLDILLTGDYVSKIYKNESAIKNTLPASPNNLKHTISNNNVTFSWDKATDNETPQNGLSYNLYVKRVSDGSLAMSPMSDLTNGFRRIVQLGNKNQVLTYTVQNIEYGEYEWYIQSVDNCFSGSVFSKGQNFKTAVPIAPTDLAANATSKGEVNLTWVDNSKGETGYVVERSIGNNQNFSPIDTLNSSITNYTDKGFSPGTLYFYRVKALYNEISSEYSNEADAIIIFTEQTEISFPGVDNGSVAWGDYDNDGDLDILLNGQSIFGVISKIFKNNGNNTFTEQTGISLPGVNGGSAAWSDYDNDGDLDILLNGSFIAKIYKNNGNNTFIEQTGISLTGVFNSSVAWGDYDNDGDLDILLTGSTGGSYISLIYKNNGNNTFTEQTGISLTGVREGSVAWGDYDNDGYLDILLTGFTGFSYISKIYKNNSNNTFTEQTGNSLTGVYNSSVAWGDYDNDGDLDILLTGYNYSYGLISEIHRNNGNNTFTEQTQISLPMVRYGSVAWGDYDNDGDLDILLTGATSADGSNKISKIYKNNGNNTFTEQTEISLSGVSDGSVAWGDYDNDGDLDILLTGESTSGRISKIYKNESSPVNTLPSIPVKQTQTVNGNSVTFSWDKATDKETPQNGLCYNLVVQSNDGKIIKSPLSDISNGIRKVVGIGNVGQINTWTLKDLPNGSYKWSVQAIDHNYAGSKFAPMSTFGVFPVNVIEMTDSKGLVEVYPNPVSQSLSVISVDNIISVDYEFADLSGRVIRKGNFIGKTVIETGSFNPGVYLIKINNGKTSETIKIIKE